VARKTVPRSNSKIEGCRRPVLKGSISHNLETHIRTTHPDEAIMLDKAKSDLKFVNSGVKRLKGEDDLCSNKVCINLFFF
jgi:hypothetical protein